MTAPSTSVSVPLPRRIGSFLGSLELTSIVLVLMMILVLFGTLEQVHLGTWLAQKKYFSSWVIFFELENGGRLPVFPGGYTLGVAWLINLVVSHATRARWEWRRAGLLLTHGGLFLLVLGQGLTQMLAQESQMAIEEGHAAHYSEDYRQVELAIIDPTSATEDVVHVVPAARLKKNQPVQNLPLPFQIVPKQFFQNSILKSGGGGPATMGVGARMTVLETPHVTSDDEMDTSSAVIELLGPEKSYGVWLVSTGLQTPQTVVINGTSYLLQLRPVRHYYPFSLFLKRFTHDRYPGTDIPKNFSSLLRLVDPETGDDRDVLIFMNNPLRYRGLTFYQASFGKGDKLSILQVVKNPVWVAPYLACVLVSLGLAWHFVIHLARFRRRAP